jgi:hypothetical protein
MVDMPYKGNGEQVDDLLVMMQAPRLPAASLRTSTIEFQRTL